MCPDLVLCQGMRRKLRARENTDQLVLATSISENKRLTVSKCREILKVNGADDYTDEQILEIRDVLYNLAKVEYEILMTCKNKDVFIRKDP